jgi:hypothetical protein
LIPVVKMKSMTVLHLGNDVLKGVYFQAVAQQKYDVYFTRAK